MSIELKANKLFTHVSEHIISVDVLKDVASKQVDEYIQNQKKRKQIYSITLEQDLYDDALIVAAKNHRGNFSKCVAVALEEMIDREVAKGLALVDDK